MDQNKPNDFVESERGIILNNLAPDESADQPAESAQGAPKKRESKIITAVLFVMAIGLMIFAASQIDYVAISDNIAGNGYEAQGELADIIQQLNLTDEGMRILRATRPELQNSEDFNNSCKVKLVSAVTLGCHSGSNNDHIYIYNITRPELDGIRQSVLAHELLHAVWARMSVAEKAEITDELKKVYDNNPSVRKMMEMYQNENDYNELHSVVGQSVRPELLSDTLRAHYARYFKDHAGIVTFYEQYNEPFERLRKRNEELEAEIDIRHEEIQKLHQVYNEKNSKLTQDVDIFNACARKTNCFASVQQFADERAALVAREEQLQKEYETIQLYINETNKLIEEYNMNTISNNELKDSIDSKRTERQKISED